jgi:hypothetical protein
LLAEERDKWEVLKKLPHLLPVRSIEDLTDEEFLWLRIQVAIDNGFARCPKCKAYGYGPYCSDCGHHLREPVDDAAAHGECLACRARHLRVIVHGKFCQQCGEPTADAVFFADLQDGKLSYEELDRMTRAPVTAEERKLLEESIPGGHRFWDADGNPIPGAYKAPRAGALPPVVR